MWGVFNLFTGKNVNDKMMIRTAEAPMYSPAVMNKAVEEDVSLNNIQPMEGAKRALNDDVGDNSESISDKKIIKNGNLTLRVESVDEATKEIGDIVGNLGGEVFATNIYERAKGQKRGSVTVRVPVDKFSEAISELKKVATQVVSESTIGRDVTEQYVDLQAQLKNKRAEEESFVKILDRAEKIDDVLAVTRQLSRVRGEIERLQGRIRYMEAQTDMSTIAVNLSEDVGAVSVSDNWRPMQTVKKSFKELVSNIQNFVDGSIRFVIVGIPSLIPFLLFLVIVYWGGKKIYAKIRK